MPLKTSLIITGDSATAQKAVEDLARSVDNLNARSTSAAGALGAQDKAQDGAASSAADMSTAEANAARTTEELGTAALAAGRALDDLRAELTAARAQADQAATGMADLQKANLALGTALDASRKSVADLSGRLDILETKTRSSSKAHGEASKNLGSVGIAAAEAEHSVRAFADSVNAGQDPVKAFTLELPRLTQAAGFMGGALGAVGEFLGGPWGIALTIGVSVLAPLIEHLLDTPDAAEQAKKALDDVTEASRTLGSVVDQTNGKIGEQNRLLAQAALLSAPQKIAENNKSTLNSIAEGFKAANKTVADFSLTESSAFKAMLGLTTISRDQVTGASALSAAISAANGNLGTLTVSVNKLAETNPALKPLRDQLNAYYESATKSNDATKSLIGSQNEAKAAMSAQGALTQTVVENQIALATATDGVSRAQAQLNILRQQEQSLFKQPYSDQRNAQILQIRDEIIAQQKALEAAQDAQRSQRTRTTRAADPTSGIDALVNQATGDIAQYGAAPTFLSKANEELAKLQQGLDKLDKIKPRSPLDVEKIAAARALLIDAGDVITANLDKPFNDFLRSQTQSLEVVRLQTLGQNDQAAALQQVISLQEKMGPLDAAHVDAIEASIEKLDDARRAQERLNAARQLDLNTLNSIQGTITSVLSGQTSLAGGAKDIFSSFKELAGAQLSQSIFGPAFEQLRDQLSGGTRGVTAELKAAIAAVKPPTNDLRNSVVSAGAAASNFADVVNAAATKAAGGSAGYNLGGLTPSLNSSLASSASDVIASNPDLFPDITAPIVVAAKQIKEGSGEIMTATQLYNVAGQKLLTGLGSALENFIGVDLKKALGDIGSHLGDALKGAAIGSVAGGVLGLDKTGSAIGGALGNVLGKSGLGDSLTKGITSAIGGKLGSALGNAVPVVGSILGSIAGGLLGGLFSKTPKGGATITDSTGSATLSGNSKKLEAQAATLAGSVQDGINQIAQQLGGIAGSFGGITIGEYKDKYRVNTVSTKLGGSSSPVPGLTSYDTAEEAEAAAIQAAIAKGAVSGLDAAVQKALGSSSDINKALQEALGVQNLEYALKGPAGDLQKIFDSFNQSAAENVRLAQTYGLDLLAVEKKNAADRTKLINDTVQQQVGSLQSLIKDLTSGSLFEGSALDKIAALNDQIAKAKADLDAGVAGAGDTLADLYQQRLAASKDAYGTTGNYAADRDATLADAQAAIAKVNAQVAAAATSDPALATTNAALGEGNTLANENNDQNAQILSALREQNALLQQLANGSGSGSGKNSNLAQKAAV